MKLTNGYLFRASLVLVLLAGLLLAPPLPAALADDQVVRNTTDHDPDSLRWAIANALDGDTITFELDSYPAIITLESELSIDRDLTIVGPGSRRSDPQGQWQQPAA